MNNFVLAIILSFFLAGCVQQRYAWDNYDQKLYSYYSNPGELDRFSEELKEIIDDNESSGRVPPGIFAEYGYVLYEKGMFSEAIEFFKKEQTKWPESNVLMTKMINISQKMMTKNIDSQKIGTLTPDTTKENL